MATEDNNNNQRGGLRRETRCLCSELRAEGSQSRRVHGRAIVFDSPGYPFGENEFEEVITREALTQELLNRSDVVFCLEHDTQRGLLGRYRNGAGTLSLELRDDGLYISCELPDTSLGDMVLEGIRRGDYSAMSFCFSATADAVHWELGADGQERRVISSIAALYDVSVVARPAYEAAEIDCDQRGRRDCGEDENPEEEDDERQGARNAKVRIQKIARGQRMILNLPPTTKRGQKLQITMKKKKMMMKMKTQI